jgi:iron complex transport system permease protein
MSARWPVTAIGFALLAATAVASLFLGRVNVSPAALLHGLFSPDLTLARLVVLELRLPRAVLAMLVGAAVRLS